MPSTPPDLGAPAQGARTGREDRDQRESKWWTLVAVCLGTFMLLLDITIVGEPPEPYERLLHAAIAGDHQLFAREDSVEETWRIVQRCSTTRPTSAPTRADPGGPRRRKPWSAATALAAAVAAYGELSPTER